MALRFPPALPRSITLTVRSIRICTVLRSFVFSTNVAQSLLLLLLLSFALLLSSVRTPSEKAPTPKETRPKVQIRSERVLTGVSAEYNLNRGVEFLPKSACCKEPVRVHVLNKEHTGENIVPRCQLQSLYIGIIVRGTTAKCCVPQCQQSCPSYTKIAIC